MPACKGYGAPAQPTPAPPSIPNAPPVIASITASGDRAEITDQVTFTAVVTDAETPLDQLTYGWSAEKGTIVGSGATVIWNPPLSGPTPTAYRVTLALIEQYQSDFGPREHRVSAESPAVYVFDSPRELSELALRFLTDFANDDVSPEECVREFWDGCRGKNDELGDIEKVRATYEQLDRILETPVVGINTDRTFATIVVSCRFLARDKQTGVEDWAIGDCALTAVMEDYRWWLCESRFHAVNAFGRRFLSF